LHATYDETISRALDVFEKVNKDIPLAGLNWFFDHAETVSEHSMDRIAALGGGIAVQHRMAYQGEYFVERYGAEAAQATPPVAKMLEKKVAMPPMATPIDDTRTLVIVVYGLYLAALLCVGLPGIAGVVLAYVKRDDAPGTIWHSHFENAIQTFWIWLGLSVIGLLTVWLVIGIFILIGAYIYFAYRTIKGLIRAIDSQAYV